MSFPGNSIDELVLDDPTENGEEETNGHGDENGESDEDDIVNINATPNKGTIQTVATLRLAKQSNQFARLCVFLFQNTVLDPRAGRIDVVMPEIKFDPIGIVQKLEDLKYKKFTRTRNRKCIDRIVTTFRKFATGVFPIGIQRIKIDRDEIELPDIEEKAADLLEFENDLYGKQRELKKLTKRKRKQIVSNTKLFDEFQSKSAKVAKIKHQANTWTEEDLCVDETVAEDEPPKTKKKKRNVEETNGIATEVSSKTSLPDDGADQKKVKKQKNTEWDKPLDDGEVEYFIPSKKQQSNGVPHVTKTVESTITHQITPTKGNKSKANGGTDISNDTPKIKKIKSNCVTPITSPVQKLTSPKTSAETKVKPASKLAHSKTSTPNIFVGKVAAAAAASAEKRVKIALKMNQSQEVVEYIRQIKQSPHLPYDSAKKPSKGVLKPNLAPSPINPFYKKLIGLDK